MSAAPTGRRAGPRSRSWRARKLASNQPFAPKNGVPNTSFAHASQDGKALMSLTCSFQEPSGGLEHQAPMPQGVPDPESLPSTADRLGHLNHPIAHEWSWARPFDIRHVDAPVYLHPAQEKVATNLVWMKTFTPVEGDANVQRAALAYASDYTLLEPILRRHGIG